MRCKDYSTALVLADDLTRPTNSIFADKMLRLDVLKETKNAGLQPGIAEYQREAAVDPGKLSDMAAWLRTRSSAGAALFWLTNLPPPTKTNQPAALLIAECQIQVKNWTDLKKDLETQDWGNLEFARHAFLARALRGQNMGGTAAAEWELALKKAESQKSTLLMLFRLAAGWEWVNEAEQILWTIVNRYPEEKWAGQMLQQALMQAGRTRPLLQYIRLQAKRTPEDQSVQNDLAMAAMLLDAQELAPFDLARKVYQHKPQNASYASTYAFALYLQKQYKEALEVMQQLKPEELNVPAVAGYYGLILKANGDVERAKSYLNWALTKGQLLPEEKKMFETALKN
jgi:predicted Zn-dependent protease